MNHFVIPLSPSLWDLDLASTSPETNQHWTNLIKKIQQLMYSFQHAIMWSSSVCLFVRKRPEIHALTIFLASSGKRSSTGTTPSFQISRPMRSRWQFVEYSTLLVCWKALTIFLSLRACITNLMFLLIFKWSSSDSLRLISYFTQNLFNLAYMWIF